MMAKKKTEKVIYSPAVIDFVTVAVEFCAFLEKEEQLSRHEWMETIIRLLPLMYVKATLLPEVVAINEELEIQTFVREQDYAVISDKIAAILGEDDTYLDVFVEDMKYSDTPVSAFISEDIADIYQDVRNFVSIYQYELTEQMNDALFACRENFKSYWGQKLVNVLRPLHSLFYAHSEEEDDEEAFNNMDDQWD
jgi:hypothetical protein